MANRPRVLVVGLGVQGHKRKHFAGAHFVATVDPVNADADYKDIRAVPVGDYDAVLACLPDAPKKDILTYCIDNGKHVLVEKPLWVEDLTDIEALERDAREKGVVLYTAYNHRFEPHFVRMKDLIVSGELGEIYSCRMFYGNGTARLVRESEWRDQGAGVLPDLGSHLLDTCRFWFGPIEDDFTLSSCHAFENKSPDHVVIQNQSPSLRIALEMTLLMWRNHFTCDILAEKGTAHIRSLCKWGPSSFTHRRRVLPSGRPPEESVTLVQDDPTWAAEFDHFLKLISAGAQSDLATDKWLHSALSRLGKEAMTPLGSG